MAAWTLSKLSNQAIVLIVFSGLALVLDLPPLVWHLKKRNIAPAALIIWILLLNLMNFINPFIWPADDLTSRWEGFGLCDVEIKLQIGSWVGLPGALACIMRTLAAVLDTNSASLVPTRAQKRRDWAFTMIFCFAIPALLMAVHYIVQPNRYAVWAISGCTPTFDRSWLSLILIYIWPLVISLLDAYYAVLLMARMHRYRTEFSRLLQQSNTTRSRFLRLFLLSVTLVAGLFPWEVYILYKNVEFGVTSYSWSFTHSEAWQLIAPVKAHGTVLFDRWLRMSAGYAVFIFFGLGDDAVRMYRGWLYKIGLGAAVSSLEKGTSKSWPTWAAWSNLHPKVKALFSSQKSQTQILRTDTSLSGSSMNSTAETPMSKKYLSTGTQTDDILPALSSYNWSVDGRQSIKTDLWVDQQRTTSEA